MSSSISKFERLDGGLVLVSDDEPEILDGICGMLIVGSEGNGDLFVRRPEVSLM